jgi:3-oxoacyl-[acyl-carrier protein] reductase
MADVRDRNAVAGLMQEAVNRFGGLDVLVNNAGVGVYRTVEDMALDDWRLMFDTNLTGVFQCCQAALPHLRRRGGGWIVNIGSLSATGPFAGGSAYCATKAGLIAFSDVLMQEVRHDGIRVSCVMPGSVNTGFGGHALQQGDWKLSPDDVALAVADLLEFPARSLPSRIELRPSQPPKKD